MKKILFALVLLIASASCQKSEDVPVIDPENKTIADITIIKPKPGLNLVFQGHETYNLLGYGYDVTSKFDHASSAKASLIDMESFLKKQSIYQGTSTSFYSDIYDGENAENLSLQLSKGIIDLEKRKLYGETLSAAFPGENPFSEKFIYGYYTKIAAYKDIWLTVDQINLIKNYLSPVFLADIDKLDVAALVEKYGTHMLTHITLGSKLNIIYQAETTTLDRVAIQNTGFDMALQSVFYLWSNRYNQDPDGNLLRMIKSPKVAYEVIGGDANKVRVLNTTKGNIVDTFSWSESITRKDAVFIKADKMVPLFSLIENAAKKAEVEKYIKTYLSKNEVKLNN